MLGGFLRRCLEKNPNDRLRDIGDLRLAMAGAFDHGTAPGGVAMAQPTTPLRPWQRPGPLLVVAAGLVGVTVLATLNLGSPSDTSTPRTARFTITPPSTAPLADAGSGIDVIVSPDGRRIAYLGLPDGGDQRMLFVRDLDGLEARLIEGTETARDPFFSPDGAWIGFSTTGAGARLTAGATRRQSGHDDL